MHHSTVFPHLWGSTSKLGKWKYGNGNSGNVWKVCVQALNCFLENLQHTGGWGCSWSAPCLLESSFGSAHTPSKIFQNSISIFPFPKRADSGGLTRNRAASRAGTKWDQVGWSQNPGPLSGAGTEWDRVGPSGTEWDRVGRSQNPGPLSGAGTEWDRVGPSRSVPKSRATFRGWDRVGPSGTEWDRVGRSQNPGLLSGPSWLGGDLGISLGKG